MSFIKMVFIVCKGSGGCRLGILFSRGGQMHVLSGHLLWLGVVWVDIH